MVSNRGAFRSRIKPIGALDGEGEVVTEIGRWMARKSPVARCSSSRRQVDVSRGSILRAGSEEEGNGSFENPLLGRYSLQPRHQAIEDYELRSRTSGMSVSREYLSSRCSSAVRKAEAVAYFMHRFY
jgi:hypothetical protein